ncbi:hypothetical protein BDQ17DRAFT_1177413, partial [Cyathus striatus]
LHFYQQNVNCSLVAQHDLIDMVAKDFDIVAIQEPYIGPNQASQASRNWCPVYPDVIHNDPLTRPCSMLLVSISIPTDTWSIISLPSTDITAIKLQVEGGKTLHIFNIYNDCEHNQSL